MNDLIVLGIETSGILCSVAFRQHDKILLEYNFEKRNAHGTLLADLVNDGLKKLKLSSGSIGLVAVGAGPGSFTGLRIGMAYAKGFCLGLDIPLIPVTNFDVIAYSVQDHKGHLLALIEARRGYYYVADYFDGKPVAEERYLAEASKIVESIDSVNMLVVHEEITRGYIKKLTPNSIVVHQCEYSAATICALGHLKYKQNIVLHIDDVEPLYLQPFAGVV